MTLMSFGASTFVTRVSEASVTSAALSRRSEP